MLSLQVTSEVSITTTATATISAWNRVLSTSASYTVNLPPLSANYGKFVGLLMDPTNTTVTKVAGAGADTIDGVASRIMWSKESAVLYGDQLSSQWTKVAGKTIPMIAALGVSGNQTFGITTYTLLNFTTSLFTQAPAAMVQAASSQLTVLRPGIYMPLLQGYVSYNNASSTTIIFSIYKNGAVAIQATNVYTSSQSCSIHLEEPTSFAVGDTITPYGYYFVGSYTTTFLLNDSGLSVRQNQFSLTEIPSW